MKNKINIVFKFYIHHAFVNVNKTCFIFFDFIVNIDLIFIDLYETLYINNEEHIKYFKINVIVNY